MEELCGMTQQAFKAQGNNLSAMRITDAFSFIDRQIWSQATEKYCLSVSDAQTIRTTAL